MKVIKSTGKLVAEADMHFKSIFGGVVHHVQGTRILASRRNEVYCSEDSGCSWQLLCEIPCSTNWRLKTATSLGRRLFRARLGHVLPISDNRILIVGFGKIYVFDMTERQFLENPAKLIGSRPLSLCRAKENELYYGEYYRNRKRRPVAIWATDDGGLRWYEAYRFNHVRHVHGVYRDPYTEDLWVTTGDDNHESAIWVTSNRFSSLKKVVFGSQQTRAVDLVFTERHVYFGSDTPHERNWIYRWNRDTGEVERLQEVESSVFYGTRIGNWILFSTACEHSRVNQKSSTFVWGTQDGVHWKRLATFRKDIWPCGYFEHGQLRFPTGTSDSKRLYLTPIAVECHEQVVECSLPTEL